MTEHPATATAAASSFAAALADDREAELARAEVIRLRAEATGVRGEVAELRARHERELADVDRLRGLGPRALLATLRGSRPAELRREEAEEGPARAAAAAGLARLHDLEARAEEVDRRLARLGDTAGRREAAAQAYAEELRTSTHPVAPEVDRVLTDLAAARAGLAELERVREAGARAAAALDSARHQLSSADGWSAYDTFAGGGMLSSSLKHSHAEDASRSIATAQDALVEFAGALRDHGPVTALRADLGIGGGTRTLDVWFDNVLTDWSVRSRIKEAAGRVEGAAEAVREALTATTLDAAALTARVDELVRRRDALLGA